MGSLLMVALYLLVFAGLTQFFIWLFGQIGLTGKGWKIVSLFLAFVWYAWFEVAILLIALYLVYLVLKEISKSFTTSD